MLLKFLFNILNQVDINTVRTNVPLHHCIQDNPSQCQELHLGAYLSRNEGNSMEEGFKRVGLGIFCFLDKSFEDQCINDKENDEADAEDSGECFALLAAFVL